MIQAPTCSSCGRSFQTRRELLVISIGRGGLAPLHPGCRGEFAARRHWLLRGTAAINRPSAWLWVIGFNLLFGVWFLLALPDDRAGVTFAWLVANVFMVIQRFLAWWCYERHVPPAT